MVKKQIHVVSLSDIKPIEDTKEDERTQIKQAIEQEERQQPQQEVDEPKPKPKRKTPPKKTKVKEDVEDTKGTEPLVESPKEATPKQSEKKIKTVELHKCDKCSKEMTLRTLRYTHPKYCTGVEINRNEVPVKRQVKPIINNVVEITPDIIENHLRKVKENKLKERQERISKLVSKIA